MAVSQWLENLPRGLNLVPDLLNHTIGNGSFPLSVPPEANLQGSMDSEKGDRESGRPGFPNLPFHPLHISPGGVVNEGGSFLYGLFELFPGDLLAQKMNLGRVLGVVSGKSLLDLIRIDHPIVGEMLLPCGALAGGWGADQEHRFFLSELVVDKVVPLSCDFPFRDTYIINLMYVPCQYINRISFFRFRFIQVKTLKVKSTGVPISVEYKTALKSILEGLNVTKWTLRHVGHHKKTPSHREGGYLIYFHPPF